MRRLYFRGDAAFANPEIYEFLEAESMGYAILRRTYDAGGPFRSSADVRFVFPATLRAVAGARRPGPINQHSRHGSSVEQIPGAFMLSPFFSQSQSALPLGRPSAP